MKTSIRGSLFGLAFGDALGAPTEFMSMEKIIKLYGPDGPGDLSRSARVTDDTQMALAVADALSSDVEPRGFEARIRQRFTYWHTHPQNTRAPGGTCMAACRALKSGAMWWDATVRNSKGCGANMRVTSVGLAPGLTAEQRAGVAQLQAAMTHGHPTAIAASDLTQHAVFLLAGGLPIADLPEALRDYCLSQRQLYHGRWLGGLWQFRTGVTEPWQFIARGWDEMLGAIASVEYEVAQARRTTDPCVRLGGGWVAHEALAVALYCALLHADEPIRALSRAAATSGDSDSIAALTGALLGATHGVNAWPGRWYEIIEYRPVLNRLITEWESGRCESPADPMTFLDGGFQFHTTKTKTQIPKLKNARTPVSASHAPINWKRMRDLTDSELKLLMQDEPTDADLRDIALVEQLQEDAEVLAQENGPREISGHLDHSYCAHVKTKTARRRCRRDWLRGQSK